MNSRITLILAGCLLAIPTLAQSNAPAPQPKVIHEAPPSQLEDVVPPAPEKPDPAKVAAIRHLLDVTNESKLADNLSGRISMQVRQAVSQKLTGDRLEKFMVDFDSEFRASATPEQVINAVIPYYSNTFSLDEIQEIVKFYESPVGQKMVQTMGQVSQESQQAGFNLEKRAALSALQGMTAEYPEIESLVTPAQKPAESQAPAPGQAPAAKPSLGTPNPPTQKPGTPHQ